MKKVVLYPDPNTKEERDLFDKLTQSLEQVSSEYAMEMRFKYGLIARPYGNWYQECPSCHRFLEFGTWAASEAKERGIRHICFESESEE